MPSAPLAGVGKKTSGVAGRRRKCRTVRRRRRRIYNRRRFRRRRSASKINNPFIIIVYPRVREASQIVDAGRRSGSYESSLFIEGHGKGVVLAVVGAANRRSRVLT